MWLPRCLFLLILMATVMYASGNDTPAANPEPVVQSVFTQTWPNGYSEIQFWINDQKCRVLTNINCSKLPALLDFNCGTATLSLFTIASTVGSEEIAPLQAAGTVDGGGFPVEWPKVNRPPIGGAAQYLIGWDRDYSPSEKEQAVRWLDAFHRHYDTHRAEIFAAWQAGERQKPVLESLARQREERLRMEAQAPPTQLRVISVEGLNPVPPAQVPASTKVEPAK